MSCWDNCIDNANLVDILSLDAFMILNPELRVSEVISSDKCWDVDKIRMVVTQEDMVQIIIGQIPLPQIEAEDSICWDSQALVNLVPKLPCGQLIRILTFMIQNGHLIGSGN